ncbi:DUF3320 domain-containing protein [Albirhodobacter sp. R86504]|uniref:DUF3320 domain-containing protein n=1 Tax=Albirhodobacter sp. R86504 TaxID=3093848 RepID=UPI00367352AB
MFENTDKTIAKVLEAARRKLLETGTRNRLIHVNRSNQRANFLNIINERSDDIYSILRVQNKRMRFKAMGKDKADGEELMLAGPDAEASLSSDRRTDSLLETPLGPDALAKRLLRLATDAKVAEEEQGLNILYLAMGFLSWRESATSDVKREAPLILLPVQLTRNERTSTFDILCRDDDITTNLPLKERLRQDFGIALPEVEETDEWSPADYMKSVEGAVSAQVGWSIDTDGIQLGFFSFAKLLMHRDLDPESWPEEAFNDNPLLNGLLASGFDADTPLFGPEDKLDDKLDPAQIIQVIDADASQTKVIEEVRRGASLVVQGPPGTGKSQTITNIIAAGAHDGKSVLFVAEKMAALSVVHERLVKSGLRDVCLELHSRTANKKALVQELGRTLAASAAAVPAASDPAQLRKSRDELNRLANILHEPLAPTKETPFSAISEIIGFIGQDASAPSIPLDGLEAIDKDARSHARRTLDAYLDASQHAGAIGKHPFRGTRDLDLQPTDLTRLSQELEQARKKIAALLNDISELSNALNLPLPRSISQIEKLGQGLGLLDKAPVEISRVLSVLFKAAEQTRLHEGLAAGAAWSEAHSKAANKFSTAAWTSDISNQRTALARGQASFLSRIFGGYRRASADLAAMLSTALPADPAGRLALADELIEVQSRRKHLAEDERWLQDALADEWRGERTPFAALAQAAKWIVTVKKSGAFSEEAELAAALSSAVHPQKKADALLSAAAACSEAIQAPISRLNLDLAAAGFEQTISTAILADLSATLGEMSADVTRYGEWATLMRARAAIQKIGGAALLDSIETGRLQPDQAQTEFLYACAEARWNAARKARPELNELTQLNRHDLVETFKGLEKGRIETAKNLILSRHFDQMPKGTAGAMGIIRGEIARKRGHKPIRWMMKNAGTMVQRIKPVTLMSPISVAQFIPPGSITFDLLVIDEASQIRPEDALGVIARARQIVVVGDQKQLPPTSFFDRLTDDSEDIEDEDEMPVGATAADMESVLSLCEARGLRQRMLEWHYRSRDPSLIQVSNAEFYGDSLVLPPSPLQLDPDYGLKFNRVAGVYARGGTGVGRQGTNRIEAEEVVKAIADHARRWPELSLGVVTFSKTQADMMTEVLERERRKDSVLDAFLREGKSEDVFVKNIENVQGDERDVILISVGYGPQEANGRLSAMTFGPVNSEGGERRLNVLFSRARVRCEVFASFDPADIDPSRVKRDGPRVLKRFLDFAKTGVIDERSVTGLEADSPFEEDVTSVIRSLGYLADPQVGTSGFRIDIGVRHPDRPGQYLMAVECDGATYHNALWARERDRLRQDILENLGWSFHRIWSTDWFHHRKREIERLKIALEEARAASEKGIRVRGSNEGGATPIAQTESTPVVDIDIGHLEMKAQPYIRSNVQVRSSVEPHLAPLGQLANLISKIIKVEGPIHIDELARRVSAAFGKSRTGARITEAVANGAKAAMREDPSLIMDGSFMMTTSQAENMPVRDRSAESGNLTKASYLPPMEVIAAANQIRTECGEISKDDMIRAVARLLGFQRVGPELYETIGNACPVPSDA